mgnify:CR=1 FL=1
MFWTALSRPLFLSTLSLRRATDRYGDKAIRRQISIHALLAESDFYRRGLAQFFRDFYPRSPCGERRRECWAMSSRWLISIHALLAESDLIDLVDSPVAKISIHALLAESDKPVYYVCRHRSGISIHALLAESDTITGGPGTTTSPFLSTLSLRRATR